MNGKDLFSGMSFVEERLVGEAETERATSGRVAWKRWTAIAACLCLILLSVFALHSRSEGEMTEGIAGQDAADSMPIPMPEGGTSAELEHESMESETSPDEGCPLQEVPSVMLLVEEMTDTGFTATVAGFVDTDIFEIGTALNVVMAEDVRHETPDGQFDVTAEAGIDYSGLCVEVQFKEYDKEIATIVVNSIREVTPPAHR